MTRQSVPCIGNWGWHRATPWVRGGRGHYKACIYSVKRTAHVRTRALYERTHGYDGAGR